MEGKELGNFSSFIFKIYFKFIYSKIHYFLCIFGKVYFFLFQPPNALIDVHWYLKQWLMVLNIFPPSHPYIFLVKVSVQITCSFFKLDYLFYYCGTLKILYYSYVYTYRYIYMCFPSGSDGKESACKAGDPGSVPGLGRSPEEGNGYPLQYFYLENSMDRGAWWATVHGVIKGQKWLNN